MEPSDSGLRPCGSYSGEHPGERLPPSRDLAVGGFTHVEEAEAAGDIQGGGRVASPPTQEQVDAFRRRANEPGRAAETRWLDAGGDELRWDLGPRGFDSLNWDNEIVNDSSDIPRGSGFDDVAPAEQASGGDGVEPGGHGGEAVRPQDSVASITTLAVQAVAAGLVGAEGAEEEEALGVLPPFVSMWGGEPSPEPPPGITLAGAMEAISRRSTRPRENTHLMCYNSYCYWCRLRRQDRAVQRRLRRTANDDFVIIPVEVPGLVVGVENNEEVSDSEEHVRRVIEDTARGSGRAGLAVNNPTGGPQRSSSADISLNERTAGLIEDVDIVWVAADEVDVELAIEQEGSDGGAP
jgi:hypothetical protein